VSLVPLGRSRNLAARLKIFGDKRCGLCSKR
jgi:hypothetical protein